MTCTIAYLDKKHKKAWLASDSCASSSYDYSIVKNEKVFHAKNRPDILIGCAGSFRLMNILKNNVFFGMKDVISCEYLTCKFIPLLREHLGEECSQDDWSVLIVTKSCVFKVQTDFAVLELTSNIEAIGNGGYVALGAFSAFESVSKKVVLTTEEKLIKCLEISKKFNTGVLEPFIVIHT